MALTASETWRGGFVVGSSTGAIVLTTNSAGAAWSGGFLRDTDGRLVVVYA